MVNFLQPNLNTFGNHGTNVGGTMKNNPPATIRPGSTGSTFQTRLANGQVNSIFQDTTHRQMTGATQTKTKSGMDTATKITLATSALGAIGSTISQLASAFKGTGTEGPKGKGGAAGKDDAPKTDTSGLDGAVKNYKSAKKEDKAAAKQEVQTQITSLGAQKESNRATIGQNNTAITNAKNDSKKQDGIIADTGKELKTCNDTIATLTGTTIPKCKGDITATECQISDIEQSIDNLDPTDPLSVGTKATLEANKAELQTKLTQQKAELSKQQDLLKQNQDKLPGLQKTLSESQAAKTKDDGDVTKLTQDNANLTKDNSQIDEKIKKANSTIGSK